jgi:hypothetical protein
MKKEAVPTKKSLSHDNDKKDLVNLDFYKHEIEFMGRKLDKVKTKALSKEVVEKVEKLKLDLNMQRNKLAEFRQSYDIEEMAKSSTQKIEESEEGQKNCSLFFENEENFFYHLEVFESDFKNVREEVLKLINNG